ncbi:formylglycine-generating enzyme family protein [Nitrospina watsonii]|uniref:FGE-sulfatase domain-containing protein n=1 Tax=Nitrospina watsonii TaxID=1323948 RepID=A0ABN8W0Q1_9BACT|nr:formylglycine-generating enzyme family protein [Nitrospina watsonii]CAI2718306.1 FGE-sulfatase domain-containing protein [Nitrospina watsonii]
MKTLSILIVLISSFFISAIPVLAENPPEGMVRIPTGCFMMGTDNVYEYEVGRKNERERPVHKVCIDAFYLDKTEATQAEYEKSMGKNPSYYPGENLPVEHINYKEAQEYCRLQGKRLPTEAEWEYAARAGGPDDYPWGSEIDGDYVWYDVNSSRKPHPVGSKKPNAWGVYDMLGSVYEWVSDWYSDHYYEVSPRDNPKGPEERQSWRVIRGGSWVDEPGKIRVTVRYRGDSDGTYHFLVGVRCARDIEPSP